MLTVLVLLSGLASVLGAEGGLKCRNDSLRAEKKACFLDYSTPRYYQCEAGLQCEQFSRCRYSSGVYKACGVCKANPKSNSDIITCDLPGDSNDIGGSDLSPNPQPSPPANPPPAPSPTPTSGGSSQCGNPMVQTVIRENNALRAGEENSGPPLVCDDQLSAEAVKYSMALCNQPTDGYTTGKLSHTLTGKAGTRCDAVGDWTRCGENILYNYEYSNGMESYEQWRDSPGHRANMVKPDFNKVGYGYYRCEEPHKYQGELEGGDRMYWTGLYVKA